MIQGRGKLFVASAFGTGILFALGFVGILNHKGFERHWLSGQPEQVRLTYEILKGARTKYSNFGADNEGGQALGPCRFNVDRLDRVTEETLLACSRKHGPGILILGDSHAIDLFGGIASRFDEPYLVGVTRGYCRPHTPLAVCQYEPVKSFLERNPAIFKGVIYEQAGFYLLQGNDGQKGERAMFHGLPLDEAVTGLEPDMEHITATLDYLQALSRVVPVKWFLPRAEPHITSDFLLRYGCGNSYSFRPNQRQIFQALDDVIAGRITALKQEGLTYQSQNDLFDFDLGEDLINCREVYWSDGDHFSTAGEMRFGRRLPADFLRFPGHSGG